MSDNTRAFQASFLFPPPVNFDDYCQQKAAPPGSSAYYALRRAPYAQQPLLTALFALRRELEETVHEIHDPSVARTKLAWWKQELGALAAGHPTHPVTRALAAHHPAIAEDAAALQALADAYEIDLDQTRYLDLPNLQRYAAQTGGNFADLVARASARRNGTASVSSAATVASAQSDPSAAASSAPAPNWAQALGQALALAQVVTELGQHVRQGRIYVPIDELQKHEVTSADLMNGRYSEQYTALMTAQADRARRALQASLAAIPADQRRAQRTLIAQGKLALALLDEIERDGFQILHQQIALTPLRKLWISWRAR